MLRPDGYKNIIYHKMHVFSVNILVYGSDSDSDSDALYLAHWPFKMKTYRCIHNITS